MASIPAYGHRTYKSPVGTASDLPVTGNSTDDVKVVNDTGIVYRWDGSQWVPVKADATPGSVSTATGTIISNVACDATVYVGAAIRMSGGVAYNALADSYANSNVLGVVETKTSATVCSVRVAGVTDEIFVGLSESDEYYLSATIEGAIVTTVPTGSGQVILKLGQPYSTTRFAVIKGERIIRA
jgi:hypothetical protein